MSEPNVPPRPDGPEPDSDQLPLEDTLVDRGVDDVLDEGYSPPDRPRTNRWGETQLEEELGESLDRRLAQEEPETWESDRGPDPQREPDRTGRLAVDDDEDSDPTGAGSQHMMVDDVGVAGGGASAEEAAMHLVAEDDEPAPPVDGNDPVLDDPIEPWRSDSSGPASDDDDLTADEASAPREPDDR